MSFLPSELAGTFHPSEVDAWLARLPVANTRECCRLVYAGLQALNAAKPESRLHYEGLEKIRRRVFELSQSLSAFFLGKPFPLDERVRKMAKLGAQFHAELAAGYQAITDAPDFTRTFEVHERARVLCRALESYEWFVWRLALIHEVPGSVLWAAVNALYLKADSLATGETPASSPKSASEIDVDAVFARIQLARVLSPSRLSQRDSAWLLEFLKRSRALMALKRSRDETLGAGFWLDLESTVAPRVCKEVSSHGANVRYLALRPLLDRIAVLSQATTIGEEHIDEPLATYLQTRLGGSPSEAVEKKTREALLIAGFDAVYDACVHLRQNASAPNEWGGLTGLDIVPFSDHDGFAVGLDGSKSAGTFMSVHARGFAHSVTSLFDGENRQFCYVQCTETRGFYLLESPRRVSAMPRLVGLNTDNRLIQTGLLHPLAGSEPKACKAVFELLQSESEPVVMGSDTSQVLVHRALWGPSTDGAITTLITEPMRVRNGDGLSVKRQEKQERYRVARVLEMTGEFMQLEVVPAAS